MKNWNTDISQFKSPQDKRLWELTQLINYGLDGGKLNENELKTRWDELKPLVDSERARMIEYLIWGKVYSLTSKEKFWNLSPTINS